MIITLQSGFTKSEMTLVNPGELPSACTVQGDVVVTTSASASLSTSCMPTSCMRAHMSVMDVHTHTCTHGYEHILTHLSLHACVQCMCSTGVQRSLSLFVPRLHVCIHVYVRAGMGVLMHFASGRKHV